MSRHSRFIRPDTTVLTLANGDTLTVKRRLNAGEARALFARIYRDTDETTGRLRVDPMEVGIATVAAYLLDWSLRDDDDRLVVIRGKPYDTVRAMLDALDAESFVEIRVAVDAHIERMDAERTAEKNGQDGETGSSATSPSPSAVAGATNGLPT